MLPFDIKKIRADFPILARKVHGKPLIYLDNASTSQKPAIVLNTMDQFYREQNANIHRGVHFLSEEATEAYEKVRKAVQRFIHAKSEKEIVFVRGATEGINLIMQSYGRNFLQAGDEIIITALEHHSNIVPWQMLRDEKGIVLKVAPIDDQGQIILKRYYDLLTPKTKLVALTQVSNAIGTINPIDKMVKAAKKQGCIVLVDGCQAVAHLSIDVQQMDCDFYVFSSHKMCGPTGIGVLYGKLEHLDAMPPYQGGGDMIREVRFDRTTYNEVPFKFEAGTPNIAGTIGLGAAIEYLEALSWPAITKYEHELSSYLMERAASAEGLKILGQAPQRIPILSFNLQSLHHHDIGTLLDQLGIAVRAGHHCAMPLMQRFGIPGSVRASLMFYNTRSEIDALFAGIERVRRILVEPAPSVIFQTTDENKSKAKNLTPPSQTVDIEALRIKLIEALRTIYDPEIPVNIYDLGLIYAIEIDLYGFVKIKMTLTTPGCPVAQSFPGEVQGRLLSVKGVAECTVELVWDPPWTQDKISEAAKLELGLF